MAVTDEQVAALRAQLAGNAAEHKRLFAELDRQGDALGYSALVNAAFFEAVDRRFGKQNTRADVIEFVADVRSRFDEVADEVDPRAAERVIFKVLGTGSTDDIDAQTSLTAKLYLLAAIIADEHLDDTGLDDFMVEVRKSANYLLS